MKTERKIKVCHVLTDTNIGGAGTALVNLLTACDRERFAFSVVLPYGSAAAPLVEKTGADIFFAHGIADRSAAPAAIPALTRIFRRLRPDIVHTHASLSARLAARAAAVPVIIMTRHCADPLPRVFSAAGGILLRGCCTRAIAVGDDAADALAACGFPRERIDVILNGTAPLREPTEAELDAARAALALADAEMRTRAPEAWAICENILTLGMPGAAAGVTDKITEKTAPDAGTAPSPAGKEKE